VPSVVHAKRQRIKLPIARQHVVDDEKVTALVQYLNSGGTIPPVVVAAYKNFALPLDGHHRMLAREAIGLDVDAWVVSGRVYDRLCTKSSNPEAMVMCGGVLAMQVANTHQQKRDSSV